MLHIANPVKFDGTNDYLTRGAALSGVSNSKLFTVSFWFRPELTAAVNQRVIWGGDATPAVAVTLFGSSQTVGILARNAADTIICNIFSSTSFRAQEWNHAIIAVDMANTSNRAIYLNGVSALTVTTYTDDTIDFTAPTEWLIGADNATAQKVNGDLADVWCAPGQYIDLSSLDNREKFMRAGGPVDLGSDGSTPTGTAPAIFLSGSTDTWQTNDGTGGGFTENGALADGGIALPTRKVWLSTPA